MPLSTIDVPRLRIAHLPTPLQPLDRISKELGGPRIWIKRDDLTGSVLSGNKVRKLEFSLGQARREGAKVLLTCGGIQSNHARATTIAGARNDFKVHLLLRGSVDPGQIPDGNLFLDKLFGAEVSFYSEEEYNSDLPGIFAHWEAHYAAKGLKTFSIPTGASDEIGMWGYAFATEEIARQSEQLGLDLRHIVSATGSGGTQAGLIAGKAVYELPAEVWSFNVSDDAAYFTAKVRSILTKWQERYHVPCAVETLPINVIDGYVGPGYAKATPEIFKTIARLARTEGIALDPVYSGKAFHGMMEQIKAGQFGTEGDLVFIHTGGVFGTFAFRDQFAAAGLV